MKLLPAVLFCLLVGVTANPPNSYDLAKQSHGVWSNHGGRGSVTSTHFNLDRSSSLIDAIDAGSTRVDPKLWRRKGKPIAWVPADLDDADDKADKEKSLSVSAQQLGTDDEVPGWQKHGRGHKHHGPTTDSTLATDEAGNTKNAHAYGRHKDKTVDTEPEFTAEKQHGHKQKKVKSPKPDKIEEVAEVSETATQQEVEAEAQEHKPKQKPQEHKLKKHDYMLRGRW